MLITAIAVHAHTSFSNLDPFSKSLESLNPNEILLAFIFCQRMLLSPFFVYFLFSVLLTDDDNPSLTERLEGLDLGK